MFDLDRHAAETVLTTENDYDHFLKVLKHSWDKKLEKLLITHADGFCYVVSLRAGEEMHLHDLLAPQQLLKAA